MAKRKKPEPPVLVAEVIDAKLVGPSGAERADDLERFAAELREEADDLRGRAVDAVAKPSLVDVLAGTLGAATLAIRADALDDVADRLDTLVGQWRASK